MAIRVNTERKGVEVFWDATADAGGPAEVQVFGIDDDEVSNKAVQVNNGKAGLFYPADFSGDSALEVRDLDGNVVESDTITV